MEKSNAVKIYQILQKFHKTGLSRKITGGMPHSEIMMLKKIKLNCYETEGVTISTLSKLLEVSKSAVSQMVNNLEDKGYIERINTKNDRRLVYVRLTVSGEQCLAKELQSLLQKMDEMFDGMGEEETEDLLRLLEKLYSIVSE